MIDPDIEPSSEGLPGYLEASLLEHLEGFDGVICEGDEQRQRDIRMALAARSDARLPFSSAMPAKIFFTIERHVCIDTTAAGGNASLLAGSH